MLVVHEVRNNRLVVLVQVGVVGEHTEALGLQLVVLHDTGRTRTGLTALRVSLETYRL